MTATVTMDASQTSEREGGLRARKKLEMMRHVQWTALELFDARGFDAVTIDEIAQAAVVSAPTIYRHFLTKEGVVLWDEYDPMLFRTLEERLREVTLLEAVRDAVIRPLDRVYAGDAARILRRATLVHAHPALRAATSANLREMRCTLGRIFFESGACRDELEADVVAGATVSSLEIAIEHWARAKGKVPLRRFVDQALRRLRRFAQIDAPAKRARR
jgi:AcrR family transcriptional regulator